MKKIFFLSLIMLCTAISAWSYTTGSVTLSLNDADKDTWQATDPTTGISVRSTDPWRPWVVGGKENGMLILGVPFFYVVTGVSFECKGSITHCVELVWNAESNEWVQANGALPYYFEITFVNTTEVADVYSVTITYHKHDFNLYEECYHEGVAATCTTPGMMEYWECSDCGHIYSDHQGFEELSRTSLEIPAINHKNKIYVEAKPATDTEDGYTVDHWHCPDCVKNFADEECTEQITDNVIIRAKNRDWLCFTANTDNSTVELNKVGEPYDASLEFTTTGTEWHPYTFGQTITLTDAGDKVYFRNASEDLAKGFSKGFMNDYYQFAMSGSIAASGNVMSLLDKTCLATTFPYDDGNVETPEDFNYFVNLFSDCKSLASAPELPAIKLTPYCYMSMFKGCTGLTSAPELSAMALSDWCYGGMFEGCTGLKQAPALPANTMKPNCYAAMFKGCTGLTEAPELLAMTLAGGCYSQMFENCTSLKTAPTLPATTLALQCYSQMFSGCTNLNLVKVPFTEWTNNTTNNWLNGVASTGTFVCPDALDKSQTGANYIPTSWTPAFEVKANKDPESVNYYSTFYSKENAYQVPNGVTAYTGVAEGNVLNLTPVADGIIPADEPVILKATQSQVYLPYTTETGNKSASNKLLGTDEETTLGANDYALSLGQYGVGFYLWNGKSIGANKAYLTLESPTMAKAFTFMFDDGETTAIEQPAINGKQSGDTYNLNGMRVNDNYKGIVIKNGKKIFNK